MENKYWEILKELNLFSDVTPINSNEEKYSFFKSLTEGKKYEPQFVYDKRDLSGLEKLKNVFEFTPTDHAIKGSYFHHFNEQCQWIQTFAMRKDPSFHLMLSNLYPAPSNETVNEALNILKSEKVFYPNDENEKLSFMEVKNILEPELLKLGFTNWKVIIKPITAKMMVSSLKNELIINENASFSRLEIERLKVHEIHTHIQRFENGKLQKYKIFQYGFSNYLETEEGLALYNEELNGVLSQDDMRKYALRVIACQWAVSKGFYELFNLLNNYVSIDDSWNLTLRVKRGLEDTSHVGGFLKDSLYLSGYMKVKNLKQSDIDNLWIGKVGIKELEIINHFLE
jgi:hypothetical protein